MASTKHVPAWHDSDDDEDQIDLQENIRVKRLRRKLDETEITGTEYAERLRVQYTSIHGERPSWATPEKRVLLDSDDEEMDMLLSSSKPVMKGKSGTRGLPVPPEGKLRINRGLDVNQEERCRGVVETMSWHPKKSSVFLTGSQDKVLRLFNYDDENHQSELTHSVMFEHHPITDARWVGPERRHVLVTGLQQKIYLYDVTAGKHISRASLHGRDTDVNYQGIASSPDGTSFTMCSSNGSIVMCDPRTLGVVRSFKMSSSCVRQGCVQWQKHLLSADTSGGLYEWDQGSGRCARFIRNVDVGSVKSMAYLHNSPRLALGSGSGVVEIFNLTEDGRLPESWSEAGGKLCASNLTTAVTSLASNPTGELLFAGSSKEGAALKAIHTRSGKCFSNWPILDKAKAMGTIMNLDVSADSKRLAVGNDKGRVLSYNLLNF